MRLTMPPHPDLGRCQHLIGLSLSFCINDVVNGRVSVEQIDKIITGTCALTDDHWEEVISDYRETYWAKDPDRAERIVRTLISLGKIEQPRILNRPTPNIASGHWVTDESQIAWR
jgi:hypothetical protein